MKTLKAFEKLTPIKKWSHIGPFTHLRTTGITASTDIFIKKEGKENNYQLLHNFINKKRFLAVQAMKLENSYHKVTVIHNEKQCR